MNPFKTQKFKALQAKWQAKLKKSGFEDIEQGDKLHRHDGDWFHKHIGMIQFESTRDFYLKCSKFFQEHEFQTKEHERVWYHFKEGKTLKEIEEHVNFKKDKIAGIINKYIEIMLCKK